MKSNGRSSGWLGMLAVFLPLFAMLGAVLWYAVSSWQAMEGPPMPMHGYIAMALGIVLSLVVGVGLMSLLFYSRRHGYDERAHRDSGDERE